MPSIISILVIHWIYGALFCSKWKSSLVPLQFQPLRCHFAWILLRCRALLLRDLARCNTQSQIIWGSLIYCSSHSLLFKTVPSTELTNDYMVKRGRHRFIDLFLIVCAAALPCCQLHTRTKLYHFSWNCTEQLCTTYWEGSFGVLPAPSIFIWSCHSIH